MATVTLPRLHWGDPASDRRALLVHGLGSSAHTMWQVAEGLAEAGYSATAIDLRGHGNAPRASRYRIDDLADDLAASRPHAGAAGQDGGDAAAVGADHPWDVVVAHSIGGAAALTAAAAHTAWTQRLILLDPAIVAVEEVRRRVLDGQLAAKDSLTEELVAAENPHWHPLDVELRVRAVRAASRFALEHAVLDNPDWDASGSVPHLACPTLVIGGAATRGAMFAGDHATETLAANPLLELVAVAAGHNVHRDAPAEVLAAMREWLAAF